MIFAGTFVVEGDPGPGVAIGEHTRLAGIAELTTQSASRIRR